MENNTDNSYEIIRSPHWNFSLNPNPVSDDSKNKDFFGDNYTGKGLIWRKNRKGEMLSIKDLCDFCAEQDIDIAGVELPSNFMTKYKK